MRMLTRRLQVLLDERQYARLAAFASEQNLSVGAAVRQALDQVMPAANSERTSALKRVFAATPMNTPPPAELRNELDALRGRRA
jgi:hypothetical protein